ncbi:MAG: energy-coupling factor transporter transmembrane protein EcfT [Candidatus Planktophila sp.]|nr:energy-coupling factor transporter transmembrane protein EcfT [Candidatus Planktophila sp.]
MNKPSLHPFTWWLWAFGLAIAIVRFDSAWFTVSCVGAVMVIVYSLRDDAPWAKSFDWTLKLSLWILALRTFIGITIGVPIPGTEIFRLPIVPLPSWMPGIRIGGGVTWERLSSALSEGLLICSIIAIFGAAASLTSPHRLLRVLPVYIYEFAVAVVIATSVLPQLVTSVKRIRMAQGLRGQDTRGFTSWKRVAIPLLEESLARSLDLAAAMDSRGYGVSKKRSRYRPISWHLKDSLVVISAFGLVVIS